MHKDFVIWCPHCGAGYRWKARFADRRYRCECGVMFRMPNLATGQAYIVREDEVQSTAAETDDLAIVEEPPLNRDEVELASPAGVEELQQANRSTYSMDGETATAPGGVADDDAAAGMPKVRCRRCNTMNAGGRQACSNCGFSLSVSPAPSLDDTNESGPIETLEPPPVLPLDDGRDSEKQTLLERARRRHEDEEAQNRANAAETQLLDFKLPVGMLIASVFAAAMAAGLGTKGIASSFTFFLLTLAIGAILFPAYLIGILLASTVIRQSYGELRVVSLKLLALAFLPDAAGSAVGAVIARAFGSPGSSPDFFIGAARVVVGSYLLFYFVRALFRLTFADAIGVTAFMLFSSVAVRMTIMRIAVALGWIA